MMLPALFFFINIALAILWFHTNFNFFPFSAIGITLSLYPFYIIILSFLLLLTICFPITWQLYSNIYI